MAVTLKAKELALNNLQIKIIAVEDLLWAAAWLKKFLVEQT